MTKPGCDLGDWRRGAQSADGTKQVCVSREGERTKASLHVRPEKLDGVQLGAVGREVHGEGTSVPNRLADDVHLVDVEVVHDDDVAGVEPRSEALSNEAKECAPANRSLAGHELRPLAESDGADERDRLPRAARARPDDTFAAQRARVLAAHAGLDEGFVDEDEAAQVRFLEERAEFFAPLSVLGRVSFEGDEGLFFREKPSRKSARWTADRLVDVRERLMSTSASSATVASGISATIVASKSAIDPWIGETLPPPRGRGSTELVSRCSRRSRFTVATPRPKSSAISRYVRPSARARTTASRSFKGITTSSRDHAHAIGSTGLSGNRAFHGPRPRIASEAILMNGCIVENEQGVGRILHERREEASRILTRDRLTAQRAFHTWHKDRHVAPTARAVLRSGSAPPRVAMSCAGQVTRGGGSRQQAVLDTRAGESVPGFDVVGSW